MNIHSKYIDSELRLFSFHYFFVLQICDVAIKFILSRFRANVCKRSINIGNVTICANLLFRSDPKSNSKRKKKKEKSKQELMCPRFSSILFFSLDIFISLVLIWLHIVSTKWIVFHCFFFSCLSADESICFNNFFDLVINYD